MPSCSLFLQLCVCFVLFFCLFGGVVLSLQPYVKLKIYMVKKIKFSANEGPTKDLDANCTGNCFSQSSGIHTDHSNEKSHYDLLFFAGLQLNIYCLVVGLPKRLSLQKEVFTWSIAERNLNFCLARNLIWPLESRNIFTQSGWLVRFSLNHIS